MVNRPEDKRIIDVKLPLTWLISTTGFIVASAFVVAVNFNRQIDALTVKMDAVLLSNTEMKNQMRDRDVKYDQMLRDSFILQRKVDALDLRVENLERKGK